jgi:hypothetical protein
VTTQTLERLDWDEILHARPECENPAGCGQEAVNRIRWTCGCLDLACKACADQTVMRLAQLMLLGRTAFQCADCGRDIQARHLSELLLITPL